MDENASKTPAAEKKRFNLLSDKETKDLTSCKPTKPNCPFTISIRQQFVVNERWIGHVRWLAFHEESRKERHIVLLPLDCMGEHDLDVIRLVANQVVQDIESWLLDSEDDVG